MAKLDRFLFSLDWDDIFPRAIQIALPKPCSDHTPIKLSFVTPRTHKPFRFDRSWLGQSDLVEVVADEWQLNGFIEDAILNIVLKIRAIRKALRSWSLNARRITNENKDRLLHQIQVLDTKEERNNISPIERDQRDQHKQALLDLYKLEEIY